MLRSLIFGSGLLLTGSVGRHGVRLLTQVLLTRILLPKDFGLVATVVAMQGVMLSFAELGLSASLIHTKKLTGRKINTALNLNILGTLLFGLILYVAAVPLARMLNLEIASLIKIACLGFIARSFGSVQRCLLLRNLDYKKVMQFELWGALSYGFVALILVNQERSTSSLLWADAFSNLFVLILMLAAGGVYPKGLGGWAEAKELLGFGGWISLGSIVVSLSQEMDRLILSWLLPPRWLGGYDLTSKVCLFIPAGLTTTLDQAAFPLYARHHDRPEEINGNYLQTIALSSWMILPIAVFFFLNAEPCVALFFGSEWTFAVPMFQAFACAGAIESMGGGLTKAVFLALGKPVTAFYSNLIALVLLPIGLFVGAKFGPYGLAWGFTVSRLLGRFATQTMMNRLTGLSMRSYFLLIAKPIVVCTVLSGASHLTCSALISGPAALLLVARAGVLLTLYGALGLLFYRDDLNKVVRGLTRAQV